MESRFFSSKESHSALGDVGHKLRSKKNTDFTKKEAPTVGLEPTTTGLRVLRSTD
jgi:hypothetical protein